ncbi:hypothetical protein DPMN_127070 [Dreissena polymorpha]|uniref:Uncharacterized protein n=1 Tax=Dreissena polymorpha TaxID=45954 RepID=A0A9D4H4J1_DREPO|nr:hypothetical protein DPMN_127070 [Dreissena polymorpha]
MADVKTSVDLLHPLFSKIWEEEEIPTEWKEGYLIKLPKKGVPAPTTEESRCYPS